MHGKVTDLGLKELIVSTCWYIWWERRKISRDEQVQKPARSCQSIVALSLNYYRASKKNIGIKRYGWQKPADEFVKLNIDAAFSVENYTENYTGATGAVIRDDGGMFIAGSSRGIPHVADAAMAEAIALRDGLLLVGQLGCNRIKVNSDCLEVVDTMKNGGNSISVAASVFEE
jgi:hypothetical protein